MTTADIESFPEDEAPTALMPDRPTPDYQIPSNLLHFPRPVAPQAEFPTPGAETHVVQPTPVHEQDESGFWDSAPRYSTTSVRPPAAPSIAPPRPRSRSRVVLAKVLFATLFTGVLALLCYEGSVLLGGSWAGVRGVSIGLV